MNGTIGQIAQVLQDELTPLQTQAAELTTRLGEVQEDIDRITAALKVLQGNGKKSRASRKKPCATKQEVVQMMTEVLADTPSMSVSDLEETLKGKVLNELNKTLNGFALRFREAQTDAQFEINNGVCRLKNTIADDDSPPFVVTG